MREIKERSSAARRLGHGAAVMVLGAMLFAACDRERREPPPECGDGICSRGELLDGCPECLPQLESFEVDLDGCAYGLDDAALEREMQFPLGIAGSLRTLGESAHWTTAFANDFHSVLVNLALEPDIDPLSVPFEFEEGVYTFELAALGSALLTIRLFAGEDYEAFAKGELLEPYAFVPEAYFIGASVDLGQLDATITFEDVGPLVELVGAGPNPESPITIDLYEAGNEVGLQELEATTTVKTTLPKDIEVSYEMTSRRKIAEGGALTPIDVVSFSAEQGTRTASVASADLYYEGAALYGTLELDVRSDLIEAYRLTIVEDAAGYQPMVFVQCKP